MAAVLTLVLTLTGVGRGFADTPPPADVRYVIAGVPVVICHSGANDQRAPADPARHDCCDACALSASGVMPAPPILSEPASAFVHAVQARVVAWVPSTSRSRSPRQSQGPPAA